MYFSKPIEEMLSKIIKGNGKIKKYIKSVMALSISVQIIIMPIMIYNFKSISLVFLISSILSSSLIGLIILLGFVILVLFQVMPEFICQILAFVYKIPLDILLVIVNNVSRFPLSKVYIKTPYIYHMIIYYMLVILIIHLMKIPKLRRILKYKKQIIIVILILVLIPNVLEIIPSNSVKIYFIDVMQGDSCLIITPQNKKILIDGGGSETYDIR